MASLIEKLINRAFFKDEPATRNKVVSKLPTGRESAPDMKIDYEESLNRQKKALAVVKPLFVFSVIPTIRRLAIINEDLSQVLYDIVSLGNTGHVVKFDRKTPRDQVIEMREHLRSHNRQWMPGAAGVNGMVNKFMYQLLIGGAISYESVPKANLTGVDMVALIKPETVRFVYSKRQNKYLPYQVAPEYMNDLSNYLPKRLIKLNPNTYKYFAINGDTEIPHGIPWYIAALSALTDDADMMKNIKTIIKQVGVLGFLQVYTDKPDQKDGETDDAYRARLQTFLSEVKTSVSEGLIDGVVVGYENDHKFEFHSPTKNLSGVEALAGLIEKKTSAGLKSDPALMGKGSGKAESATTIIFTKLLSELTNIQNAVAHALEFIYEMELRLAGYNDFKSLRVEFNESTIQDKLKTAQAKEIEIRNYHALYWDGVISLEEYADAMIGDLPDVKEPRARRNIQGDSNAEKDDALDRKNKSERGQRKKAQPQDKKRKE